MKGGDRWDVQRWSGGVHDNTIINQVMFRFRPIAPKPVTGDSYSGESRFNIKSLDVSGKRKKRKYVRVCQRNNNGKKQILDDDAKEDHINNHENKGFVTLQLMPEKADLKKSIILERSWDVVVDDDDDHYRFQDPPPLFFKLKKMVTAADHVAAAVMGRMRVVESSVTAGSVTESCINEGEMGKCTDEERMKNLEEDTCPGFVTDGLNRVMWVNQAYKNMVGLEEGAETTVGLVVKEGFSFPCGAFSCRIRLRYVDGKGKNYSKTVPSDVWKLSSGGYAWWLDVNAALSLGL